MLHVSQDAPCHPRVAFWRSERGLDAFVRMTGSLVDPPPRRGDPELARALRAALPHGLFVQDAVHVDDAVHAAARAIAEQHARTRVLTSRFDEWVSTARRPRYTAHASSDRGCMREDEMHPPSTNPYHAQWLASAGIVPTGPPLAQ